MVGRFREDQVQQPLADEELEILFPQGVWLAVHQLCQAAQREESPLAELQQHIDQHLASTLPLARGCEASPSSRERNVWERASRSSTTGNANCSEIRQPSRSRCSAKFGELAVKFGELAAKIGELDAEIRGAGPKTSSGLGIASPGRWTTATRPPVDSSKPAYAFGDLLGGHRPGLRGGPSLDIGLTRELVTSQTLDGASPVGRCVGYGSRIRDCGGRRRSLLVLLEDDPGGILLLVPAVGTVLGDEGVGGGPGPLGLVLLQPPAGRSAPPM